MEILKGLSRDLSLAFDIGAHWGYTTLVIIGEAERVIAIEPSPQNVTMLRNTINANGLSQRVQIVPAAIGASIGSTALSRGYTSFEGRIGGNTTRTVQVTTVDELVREFGVPDLVKIDIEGGAEAALSGAADLIAQGVTRFLIEVHNQDEAQAVREMSGYALDWLDPGHVVALPQ